MKKADDPQQFDLGKDEMNLLEYSVFSSSTKIDRSTKSIKFCKQVWCRQKQRRVDRKLTMAFSAEYGRPTTRDDQLYVALLKRTCDTGFESPKVYFTRYELLNILGWSEEGRNYQRIDDGFNRICGTLLNWQNAYWDKAEKSWVDRKFHIIDDVKLYSREKFDEARVEKGVSRPRSWFKWSDVLFQSFQSGYIKSLNMDVFRDLEHDMSKKIYRYVDKHFNNDKRPGPVELPLEEFAVQKLGFKRAKPSKLKDMLGAPIKELEQKGHLRGLLETSRFPVGDDGATAIRFERPTSKRNSVPSEAKLSLTTAKQSSKGEPQQPIGGLAGELVARGVTRSTAISFAKNEPEESARQIEYFDFRLSTGWEPKSSPGGYLRGAINERYGAPKGFKSAANRAEEEAKKKAGRRRKAQEEAERLKQVERDREARQQKEAEVEQLMQGIPEERQIALENEALKEVAPLIAEMIRKDRSEDKLSTFRVDLWHEHIIPKHF